MSGHNYSYQDSGRLSDRSDSYESRKFDHPLRNYRGRGSYRGRAPDYYRGRGGYKSRDYGRDYRERDPRDREPEWNARDRDPRDRGVRDPRGEYRPSDRDEYLRPEREERPERPERRERMDRPDRPERFERLERPDRSLRPYRGGFRGDVHGHRERENESVPHRATGSGASTPSERERTDGLASKYADPWISILHIGEGKTAARMNANYKDLVSVNKSISQLQEDAYKLQSLLATLEVYGARDALNVEISKEKLDEFTYL